MKILVKTFYLALKIFLFFTLSLSIFLIWAYSQFPSQSEIKGCLVTSMYKVNLCPESNQYVHFQQISPYMQKSVVISEDASFWTHSGFDFQEMEESFAKNLKSGKLMRGGSTITQQLAKNMFLSKEKTFSRKFVEAIITLQLEKVLTKREILERYLNVVQFGKNIFGVRQAAVYYFNKHPKDLNLPESAFLTFLLPNPEKLSVSFHKGTLSPYGQKRLRKIIRDLFEYGRISEEEYAEARQDLNGFLGMTSKSEVEDSDLDDQNEDEDESLESPSDENLEEGSEPSEDEVRTEELQPGSPTTRETKPDETQELI